MNRVLKKFLIKLLAPVAIITYTLSAFQIGSMFANPTHGIAAMGVMIVGPMLIYMLRETWLQAKREVEWENSDLMRDIKDA